MFLKEKFLLIWNLLAVCQLWTHEDICWQRCDIKTTNLLASTLVNQKAKDGGFDDAIFVRNGVVTEATYANIFVLDNSGKLITRQSDNLILGGITRLRIIELLRKKRIFIEER